MKLKITEYRSIFQQYKSNKQLYKSNDFGWGMRERKRKEAGIRWQNGAV